MSAASIKSLGEHCRLTEDDAQLRKTCGENVNMSSVSVRSDIASSSMKVRADSMEVDHCKKELATNKEAVCSSRSQSVVNASNIDVSVEVSNGDSLQVPTLPRQSLDSESDDLRRKVCVAELAKENSTSAEPRGSRLSVRSEVAEELASDSNVVEDYDKDDITVSRTSVRSQKADKTDSHRASVKSLGSDKSRRVTDIDDVAASRTSVRSNKSRNTSNKKMRSEVGSVAASLVSVRSDDARRDAEGSAVDNVGASDRESRLKPDKVMKSLINVSDTGSRVASVLSAESLEAADSSQAAEMETSLTSLMPDDDVVKSSDEHVGSRLSVRPTASVDVEVVNSAMMGSRSSVRSVNSELSSSSFSVITSKPPKRVALGKNNSPTEPTTATTNCTSGSSLILHFL